MASNKKRRKSAKVANLNKHPRTGTFRHPDGDRRHRGKMTADEGLANKRAMQQFSAGPPPGRDEEE
ncbi:MAG TPA: hypothetical protein VGZ25_14500 [Gemmataceae bacterium]|jgi:hypothetical protein|nr:hypothetical protein [Gemmataceae bacterium]